jgi:hypothetical protein
MVKAMPLKRRVWMGEVAQSKIKQKQYTEIAPQKRYNLETKV